MEPKRAIVLFFLTVILCFNFIEQNKIKAEETRRSRKDEKEELKFKSAKEAVELKQYERALVIFSEFLEEYPKSKNLPLVYLEIGKIYHKQKNYEKACANFQEVVDRFPFSEEAKEARWGLGICYYRMEQYEKVVQSLTPLYSQVKDSDKRAEIAEVIGNCEMHRGNLVSSMLWYGKAESELSDGDERRRIQGILKDQIFSGKLADKELEKIAEENVSSWLSAYALYKLSLNSHERGDIEESQRYLKRIASGFPNFERIDEVEDKLKQAKKLKVVKTNRIGLLVPLTGPYKELGERVLKGSLLAGKIFIDKEKAFPIEIRVRDSGSDPQKAVSAMKELAMEDNVLVVVGPIISSQARAVADTAQELGVPMISLSPAEALAKGRNMVFQNCLTKSLQVQALVEWASKERGIKRFAILYPNDKYGTEFANFFSDEVKKNGAIITASISYDPKQTDFSAQIKKLGTTSDSSAGFEALFIPDDWRRVSMITAQLRYHQVKGVQLLGTSGWNSPELLKNALAKDIESAVFVDLIGPQVEKEFQNYSYKYTQEYNEEPGLLDAQAFETVSIIIEILSRGDLNSRIGFVDLLTKTRTEKGVLGPLTVNSEGEFLHPLHLFKIENGEFRLLR